MFCSSSSSRYALRGCASIGCRHHVLLNRCFVGFSRLIYLIGRHIRLLLYGHICISKLLLNFFYYFRSENLLNLCDFISFFFLKNIDQIFHRYKVHLSIVINIQSFYRLWKIVLTKLFFLYFLNKFECMQKIIYLICLLLWLYMVFVDLLSEGGGEAGDWASERDPNLNNDVYNGLKIISNGDSKWRDKTKRSKRKTLSIPNSH